ncbi:2-polyprenyl-6-methoxyphenol hydroxylase-like FAD-dependent oxidoreductase [Streptomyces sp. SAI-133]|uniref:FAD-dependent monooxygenase n=1 Tax=unclassified Streptomyces TaxID=2593676 RepID=UPI0024751BF7|nr:FAD-dependent monooxygenase [Streptomyces sp. SAI-133]MDH6590038.1 2-polyprenyl-6-methoxyphenol hydroxylase-like FAD-dependent oxidoreductase [Streptomyces sp. SAI-133]
MRVACIGGGPGGLFFATLLKRNRPGAEVVVFERNRPDDTFGFGVVFSDATLGAIDAADPVLSEALEKHGRHWNDIEVRVHGARERVGGMGMAAVVRKTLLNLLQDRARAEGVVMRFEQEIREPAELDDFDLVVVCDGANSRFRTLFADDFAPTADVAGAKFIWFGTTYMFDGLTFVHQDGPHGVFAAHAYPISDSLSTFIVETDADSWAKAGLDAFDPATPPGASDEKTKAYLEDLFRDQIDGHPLVGNNSRWANFATRRARSWRRGNWVLLGDAAHTAHFSVGSGTKMAMEDAVALAEALGESPYSVPGALELYEERRRPGVEKIQDSARPSLSWWEHFGQYVRCFDDPVQFAFHFLSRSIPRGKLAVRDAMYVDRVDRWWQAHHDAPPLETPLSAGPFRLPTRRVTASDGALHGSDGTEIPMVTFTGQPSPAGVWIDAPDTEEELPLALVQVRETAQAGAPLVGVRGGTALTRVLVAEEARLAHGLPAAIVGAYDDDQATTLLLSGRADLMGGTA